jgi:hypothetical protein
MDINSGMFEIISLNKNTLFAEIRHFYSNALISSEMSNHKGGIF